jgi:diaminohydroxyphosphoribosylaminopyrimidine deaminase/5-amino-6-(5-phosphoribosylamino)uracil reductase
VTAGGEVTGGDDEAAFMRRAIALALPRLGRTRPNPTVGCVVVRDGGVVGEAATGEGGRPHAEEAALAIAGPHAHSAVAYVTLEPCGERTSGAAACADRLIAAGVARVAIACADPSLKAAGRGLERMRAAGIAVTMGLLADEAQVLCEGFLHRERTGRPLVAESADGSGFEARFAPQPGEAPEAALFRLGQEGFTRLWVPAGGVEAKALAKLGLIAAGEGRLSIR